VRSCPTVVDVAARVSRAEVDVVRPVAAAMRGDGRCSRELPLPQPNRGEGTNLRKITVRRAEPQAGLCKGGTRCDSCGTSNRQDLWMKIF
jgi:hypothetical protein